jgi:hypothetical protein
MASVRDYSRMLQYGLPCDALAGDVKKSDAV